MPAHAALKVLATTPDWAALVNELGGDKVNVYTATSAFQDVHRVDAKPSLVARARTADLVVATGADLEIGWMPVLLQDSGNTKIQPGSPGYFEAAPLVHLLEVPSAVDRSMGDIHPLGNPHVTLDPRNIAIIAKALAARLAQLDPANAAYYGTRGEDFQKRWSAASAKWEAAGGPAQGGRSWSSSTAIRCTCATGSGSRSSPPSSRSPACPRVPATSPSSSPSSPPHRRR